MKKSVTLILILILVIACSPVVKQEETKNLNKTLNETIINETKEKICDENWFCINSSKILKYKNCSIKRKAICEWGCENGVCKPEPIPEPKNDTKEQVKEIIKEETQVVSVVKLGNQYTLPLGDRHIYVEGSGNTSVDNNITIYSIQSGQVKFKINDDKTDWIMENNNFTSYGMTIHVEEILFQSYGIKEVVYKLLN